jgi:hypothetical protein
MHMEVRAQGLVRIFPPSSTRKNRNKPLLLEFNQLYLKSILFIFTLLHRRLCRVKNMLAMYLKYHKAGLTPTTPVTSTVISPVKMLIGRKSLTNLRSEMIFLQGKPVCLYLPTICTPILTDNPPILLTMDTSVAAKGKKSHMTYSVFRSFSGFIIYKY